MKKAISIWALMFAILSGGVSFSASKTANAADLASTALDGMIPEMTHSDSDAEEATGTWNGTLEEVPSLDQARDSSITIHPRSTWGAEAPKPGMTPFNAGDVQYLVVHHFENNSTSWRTIKSVQKYHMYGRPSEGKEAFFDIGYHYIIAQDDDGEWQVYEGRVAKYRGAHSPGLGNEHGLAIAFPGSYGGHEVPAGAKKLFLRLAEYLMMSYSRQLMIVGHGQGKWNAGGNTSCPGKYGARFVNEAREHFGQPLLLEF